MKRWTFACVFIMALILVLSFTFSANAASVEALESIYDVMKKDGNFVFTIGIDDTAVSYSNAYLTVALYDKDGKLADVSMTEVTAENTNNIVYLAEDKSIASYAVMLLDGENLAKPLCKPLKETVNYEDITDGITFLTDDLYEVSGNRVVYYENSSSSVRKTLKVSSAGVSFNLNNGLETALVYDISELINLDLDTELKFVETTGDMYFDEIIATHYDTERVYDIDVAGEKIMLGSRWTYFDFTDDGIEYVFEDDKGNALSLSDFAIDDVVAVVSSDTNYSDAAYLRLIKLTDNAVEGVVTQTATNSGRDFVWINDVKYEDYYGIGIGEEGTFFISMTGKIFDFEPVPPEYAYILEAAIDESMSFAPNVWKLKLLTKNGIDEYRLSDNAHEIFEAEYKYNLDMASSDTSWLYVDNNVLLNNEYRFIVYETNDAGEISSFDYVGNDNSNALLRTVYIAPYNSSTKKLDGNYIEDDTLIFVATSNEADESYTTDITKLVDGNEYEGVVLKVDDVSKILLVTFGELYAETTDEGGSEETNLKYAYILQAAKTSGIIDVWELQLLIEDNAVTPYTLTDKASEKFETVMETLGISSGVSAWYWEDNKIELNNAYRFIVYETNSEGNISYFEFAKDYHLNAEAVDLALADYNSSTKKLGGNIIYDDTLIFDVTSNEAVDAYVSNINYLSEDCRYNGLIVKIDYDAKLVLISNSEFCISDNKGFAIVTEKRNSIIDSKEVVIVDYIQDMTESSVIFNDDSAIIPGAGNINFDELNIGDVIVFQALPSENSTESIVKQYAVLGQINSSGLFDVYTDSLLAFSEDNEFIYGYIASEDGGASANFDFVGVGGITDANGIEITLAVGDESNTYSYFDGGISIEIKTNYIAEDADFYKEGSTDNEDEATFFFARVIDGIVSDIYTFNNRIVGLVNIEAEAANSIYVNCSTWEVITNEMSEVGGEEAVDASADEDTSL